MNKFKEVRLLIKELGFSDIFSYAIYQYQMRSGRIRRLTPVNGFPNLNHMADQPRDCIGRFSSNWAAISENSVWSLFLTSSRLADSASFRPFGSIPVPITLNPPLQQLKHWTEYSNTVDGIDIKKIWEPARFIWAIDLAHSYSIRPTIDLASYFWNKVEEFLAANPVNCGPNWASAQEVALRLVAWIIALGALKEAAASTPERIHKVHEAIWQHGTRILPTLGYARSQNNNHILSESLGLVFAGEFLKSIKPDAAHWTQKGEMEFERALLKQIEEDGTYSQHSANYHRMMLQLALLYDAHIQKTSRNLPAEVKHRLAQATRWLIAQLDPVSGRLPNLGHNDGSLILSLGCSEFRDYRPTAQAASLAFLGQPCLPPGHWDLLAEWLELKPPADETPSQQISSPAVHKVQHGATWGTLRGVKFNRRPAHADQLHVDLWWDGINIASDAGTYSYNDPIPWQNSLDSTRVHNTVTIDEQDQMKRVSRFLWLDQANAKWEIETDPNQICASHNGYQNIDYAHSRCLRMVPGSGFIVTDNLTTLGNRQNETTFTLQWLLPPWRWKKDEDGLLLFKDGRRILLIIQAVDVQNNPLSPCDVSLISGGQTLFGSRQDPILGWISDTYSEKHVALSYSFSFYSKGSIRITTEWKLTNEAL